jgi:hypothetical protein
MYCWQNFQNTFCLKFDDFNHPLYIRISHKPAPPPPPEKNCAINIMQQTSFCTSDNLFLNEIGLCIDKNGEVY